MASMESPMVLRFFWSLNACLALQFADGPLLSHIQSQGMNDSVIFHDGNSVKYDIVHQAG